jgi:phosphatidylglycerophosphate synthase
MQKTTLLPSFVTVLRGAALPFLLYAFSQAQAAVGVGLFVFMVVTDLADGFLSRKLAGASRGGAMLDVAVDFAIILGMFTVFTVEGFYPIWLIGLIVFGFVQFVFSSFWAKKLYDPIGKYYGGVLFVAIFLTLLFPVQGIFWFVTIGFTFYTALSVSTRVAFLLGLWRH